MLTVQEVASRLKISVAAVYALCAAHKIEHGRIGLGRGVIRISEAAVDRFVESSTVIPEVPAGRQIR